MQNFNRRILVFSILALSLIFAISLVLFHAFHLNSLFYPVDESASHMLRINILLNNLRKECSSEEVGSAQNTFMDLQQEWQYQDVVMLSQKSRYYFPSDSLNRLDSLVNQLNSENRNDTVIRMILKEIKYINQKIDAM